LRPDAPADLEAVVLRCLEKERGWRFATVAELALALVPLVPQYSSLVDAIVRVGVSDPGAPRSRPGERVRMTQSPSRPGERELRPGRAISATPLGATPLGATPLGATPFGRSTAAAWSPSVPAKPHNRAQIGMAVVAGMAALTAGGILAVVFYGPPAENASSEPTVVAPATSEPTPADPQSEPEPEAAQPPTDVPKPRAAQPKPDQSASGARATPPNAKVSPPPKAQPRRPPAPPSGDDPFAYQ
jgi:hypothetical protein